MKYIKLTGDWKQSCIAKLLDTFSNTATTATARPRRNSNFRKPPTISSFFFPTIILHFLFPILILSYVSCVVVYQVRFIATKSGRTDYAVAGESIELSCHYIMKDDAEDIKQLIWSKDGKNFLKWRKNKPGLEVLSYTFKGHIDPASTYSHITIHNVTIDMHGKYTCYIKTDLGVHEMEQDLIVISQTSCKLNDWRVTSQPGQCRETFKFDCRNMFPKPVPSCGLWNSKFDKFIRSITVDISEEPNKQTYRIKYSDKFELTKQQQQVTSISNSSSRAAKSTMVLNSDLLQYAGHLMFKCDIIIPETSWKLSIMHRMFDYNDGCYQNPLETIERMRHNYSYYAASKLQQAGYLMDRQLDDFGMLASQLKYEILPGNYSHYLNTITSNTKSLSTSLSSPLSTSQLSPKVELNCWQKPVIGSIARLSCATQLSQVKLMGTNLLQCQPTGWVPILESSIPPLSTAKKHSSRHKSPRFSRQGGAKLSNNGNQTGNLDLASNNNNNNSDNKNSLEDDNDDSTASDNSNDLEESMNAVEIRKYPKAKPAIPTAAITTTTPTDEILVFEDNQSAVTLSALQQQQQGPTNLSPAQLAALLPTCVSTKRRHQSIISNRLPLLDEARILESSSNTKQHLETNRQQQQDKNRQRNSIFNLSPSGSETKFCYKSHHQAIATISLMFLIWFMLSIRQNIAFVVQQQQQQQQSCKR